jgi:hypothetical protein
MKAGLLITSASHMPRALSDAFELPNFRVQPYPIASGSPPLFAPYATGSVDFGRGRRRLRIGRALGHAVENEMVHLPHLVS